MKEFGAKKRTLRKYVIIRRKYVILRIKWVAAKSIEPLKGIGESKFSRINALYIWEGQGNQSLFGGLMRKKINHT